MFKTHTFLLLACLALFLGGCTRNEPTTYRLTYSVFFPSVHIQSRLAEEWAREIEKRTNGRVKIVVFSGSVLSGASENYDCVANGVSDIGMSCLSYSRGLFPLSECLDLPLGYPNGAEATRIANAFLKEFDPEEFKDTQTMYLHAHGPGVLASVKPVHSLAEMKNLATRGTGVTAQVIRQLEGNAVGLPQGETYEALRKGVVKATLCPVETLRGWKQGEVINHVVEIPAIGYTTAMFVTMNKNTWNKLPPDIQKIIRDVNEEWIPKHGKAWDEADEAGRSYVTRLKKTFYKFSDEENQKTAEKLAPMLDAWATQADKKGLPGHKAIQFIQNQIKGNTP